MPIIKPFKAYRYNQKLIGDIRNVTAPPYDLITPDEQRALYNRHQSNIIRVLYREDVPGQDKYRLAADSFNQLLDNNLIVEDKTEAIYLIEERFRIKGESFTRRGVIHLLQIEKPGEGNVFEHAETLDEFSQDRFKLLEAVEANLSPVLSIVGDPENALEKLISSQIERRQPILKVADYYDTDRDVYVVTEQEIIGQFQKLFAEQSLLIADGHHRYEAALCYRDKVRAEAGDTSPYGTRSSDYVLCGSFPSGDPSLKVFPNHRVVYNIDPAEAAGLLQALSENFEIEELPHYSELKSRMEKNHDAIGMATATKRIYLLKFKNKEKLKEEFPDKPESFLEIDVNIVHDQILKKILQLDSKVLATGKHLKFYRGRAETFNSLQREEENQLAFFLNPISFDDIEKSALAGCRFPQKSFTVSPSLLSGLVFYKLTK